MSLVDNDTLIVLKNEGVIKFLERIAKNAGISYTNLDYDNNEEFRAVIDMLNESDPLPNFACLLYHGLDYPGALAMSETKVYSQAVDANGTNLVHLWLKICPQGKAAWMAGPLASASTRNPDYTRRAPSYGFGGCSPLTGENIKKELEVYPALHIPESTEVGTTFEYNGIKFLVTNPNWAIALQSIGQSIYDSQSPVYQGSTVQQFIREWFGK